MCASEQTLGSVSLEAASLREKNEGKNSNGLSTDLEMDPAGPRTMRWDRCLVDISCTATTQSATWWASEVVLQHQQPIKP
jgi:hypothetical protein